MITRQLQTIIRKELKEIIRDRITFFMLFAGAAAIPLLIFSMNYIYKNNTKEIIVAFSEDFSFSDTLFDEFMVFEKDFIITEKKLDSDETVWHNNTFDVLLSSSADGIIFTYYSDSYNSYEYTKKLYSEYQEYYITQCLSSEQKPYKIQFLNENGAEAQESKSVLNVFIPLILIMTACQGTMELGAGLIAGERERGTLELLLLNTQSKKIIFLGKAIVLLLINLLSIMLGLVTLFFSSRHFQLEFLENDTQYVVIFTLLFFLSILCSSTALGLSAIIKSYRSAQLVLSIVSSLPSVLMGTIAYGITLKWSHILIRLPLINLIEAVYETCLKKLTLPNLLYCMLSNLLVIWILIQLFKKFIKSELI